MTPAVWTSLGARQTKNGRDWRLTLTRPVTAGTTLGELATSLAADHPDAARATIMISLRGSDATAAIHYPDKEAARAAAGHLRAPEPDRAPLLSAEQAARLHNPLRDPFLERP